MGLPGDIRASISRCGNFRALPISNPPNTASHGVVAANICADFTSHWILYSGEPGFLKSPPMTEKYFIFFAARLLPSRGDISSGADSSRRAMFVRNPTEMYTTLLSSDSARIFLANFTESGKPPRGISNGYFGAPSAFFSERIFALKAPSSGVFPLEINPIGMADSP